MIYYFDVMDSNFRWKDRSGRRHSRKNVNPEKEH